eukprot:Gb_01554 [translate_table: standard]
MVPLTKEKLQELSNLFIAGDANQDGVLTFTEFQEIISSANPTISSQSALRMFRETLLMMPDGGDSISAIAFATIAHSYGICAPPNVIFELIKKTWSQVKGEANNELLKDQKQRDEFERLTETLLRTITERLDVNQAIHTFQTLVLKFCNRNKEEKAEEEEGET